MAAPVRRRAGVARVAVLVLGTGLWLLGRSEPTPWHKPAAVVGTAVRLTYTGSACQADSWVEVGETATRVTLTVRVRGRATSCTDVGVRYSLEADLAAPLGERELVDGACALDRFAHRSDCP